MNRMSALFLVIFTGACATTVAPNTVEVAAPKPVIVPILLDPGLVFEPDATVNPDWTQQNPERFEETGLLLTQAGIGARLTATLHMTDVDPRAFVGAKAEGLSKNKNFKAKKFYTLDTTTAAFDYQTIDANGKPIAGALLVRQIEPGWMTLVIATWSPEYTDIFDSRELVEVAKCIRVNPRSVYRDHAEKW